MNSVDSLLAEALDRHQGGDCRAAESLCREALRHEPLQADAIYLLGVLALGQGLVADAVLRFHHVTLLQPDKAAFHHALGEALRAAGRPADAAACFRTALSHDAESARVHHSLGVAQMELQEIDQAVISFRRCLELDPDQPRAHTNLGQALHHRGDLDGAAACFCTALRLDPAYAIAHNNLGAVLQLREQFDEAESCFRRALALEPRYPEAHFNLGSLLAAGGDASGAAGFFREATRLRPEYARAHHGLGQALETLCDFAAALASYREAVRLRPDDIDAHQSLGSLLLLEPNWEAARAAFEKVLELQPANAEAFARLFFTRQVLCDWRSLDGDLVRLWDDAARAIAAGEPTPVQPFCSLTLPWSAEQQLAVARSHSDAVRRPAPRNGDRPEIRRRGPAAGKRLRIGYLSGEFRNHAVSHLIQGVFGCHDREGFEVFAYSFGPDDGSPQRRRIRADCDHFRDLRAASLAECERTLREDGLHILVDLQGHIGYPRLPLLALRPAPVQVHYMGFPGPIGAEFIDYVIGDSIVTPPGRCSAYREQLAILPHCYIPTDDSQPGGASAGTRTDHGLPERGAVFCAFNNSYKLEPVRFGTWMRILERTPGSVLWLSQASPPIERNLRREAESRGVASERLIFARHEGVKPQHLARHRLADLYLDTRHYNGHTTAVDALWAGLPVLTCPGETFASRVAASLLTNIGLADLIASDEDNYERQAVRLASVPQELEEIRTRLAANRANWPLFDTARLTHNLEQAYRAMWAAHAAGERPGLIRVEDPAPEVLSPSTVMA